MPGVGETVKRLVVVLSLVACGAAPRGTPVVSLAPPQPLPAAPRPPRVTLLGDCRIAGTGERRREGDEAASFEVFESKDAREPAFVIAHPERAHVAWSGFPARADDGRGRARVELGGQEHVRYAGYAGLWGRTFTTKARMDSVPGHLWARAGAPIEMMSATAGGDVFARVATTFVAPRTIVVEGNCAAVVYDPDVADIPPPRHDARAVNAGTSFELFASPTSARPLTTVTLAPGELVSFDVLERRGGLVHVAADEGYVGIDAWIPASQVTGVSGRGVLGPARRASPGDLHVGGVPRSRVAHDTPLFVGDDPAPLRGAVVETNAVVLVADPTLRASVGGRHVVAFDFADGLVAAPEGRHLWIASDALVRAP